MPVLTCATNSLPLLPVLTCATNSLLNVGVPSNPELAETYYSQFEDFEKDDEDEAGGQRDDDDDDDDGEGTLVAGADDDVEDLINCMKNALDKSDTCKLEF